MTILSFTFQWQTVSTGGAINFEHRQTLAIVMILLLSIYSGYVADSPPIIALSAMLLVMYLINVYTVYRQAPCNTLFRGGLIHESVRQHQAVHHGGRRQRDIESIRHYHPEDATTNPSLLLKAAGPASIASGLIDDAIAWAKTGWRPRSAGGSRLR